MSFDFWSVVNNTQFQESAAAEAESRGGSFKNFEEPGEYNVTIKHAEMRDTRAGDKMLALRVAADSGESGFWHLLVGHGDGKSQAAQIAQKSLASILKYSGAKATGAWAMIGLRVKVWVKMREDDQGNARPEFRPIGPADDVPAARTPAPKPAITSAQKPAAPAARPAVKADLDDEMEDGDIPF